MATVEFRNVTKVFTDSSIAVEDFSLTVADGELLVLVGPSGCGKSTILRMLAGLEEASSGDILIDGVRVNNTLPQARNIAMVFQNYALYPHMTVHKNLEFPLKMMKLDSVEIEKRIHKTADLLDLSPYLERKPKQLSGGQRQRVAMGRALVRNPSVFLMDEPLSNLDAKLRIQIRAEIATLQQRMATTTIYVTHDQTEAMTLGHHVAVLSQGQLQQVAPPQELYQNPANTFVAEFIGSPGMNLIPATLSRSNNGQLIITTAQQVLQLPDSLSALHKNLESHLNKPLTLGLRPEAFYQGRLSESDVSIDVDIKSTELLGHEILAYFQMLGNTVDTFVARLATHPDLLKTGPLTLHFNPNSLYFFDGQGCRIC